MNPNPAHAGTPRTVEEYLAALRLAFGSADRALIQDALYDAEEYLRNELADRRGQDEAAVLAEMVGSYGAPEEVAAAYLQTEVTVQRALGTPRPAPAPTPLGRFVGVAVDPRTYASLAYLLLSVGTGIFYFTWATAGTALSLGLMVLIIGIPFLLLFLGSVRLISLVEGRLVEALLGVRMPRRPQYATPRPFGERMRAMLLDRRTWSTLLYMVLMLPLGIGYFVLALVGVLIPAVLTVAPIVLLFHEGEVIHGLYWTGELPQALLLVPLGLIGLLLALHAVRGVGRLHGMLARALLVEA
jgi:hypothetical protein